MTVLWPPGYYVLRDRVPFALTCLYLLYLQKPELRDHYKHITYWLIVTIVTVTAASLTLYLTGGSLTHIFGISWTYPAPIEWGTYILAAYTTLKRRAIPGFEALYLSLITALAGGWIYEIPRWVLTGDYWGILSLNITKIFFIRFQIICIPIAAWILINRTNYKAPEYLAMTAIIYLFFIVATAAIPIGRYSDRLIEDSWRWIARVPTQLIMLYILKGIGGPADE